MTASATRRSPASTGTTSRISSSPMRCRSAAAPATNSPMATPLAEDGFLYVTDSWGVLYKIDGTLRRCRPHRVAHGSQAGTPDAQPRRRPVGQPRHHRRRRFRHRAAHHRDRQGNRQGGLGNLVPGYARRDRSRRRRSPSRTRSSSAPPTATRACATGSAALDAATGKRLWRKYTIPAPGEPGSETWKDNTNAWQTGGGAVWVTGTYDPRHQPDHLGHRQSGADVRSDLSAGRQSLHQQRDLLGPRHRQDELVLPVHAGRHVGLRRGRHPHPDRRQHRAGRRASSSPIRRATASSTRWSAATARW